MTEKSEYDLQREERIRRNQAMLAKLQVSLLPHCSSCTLQQLQVTQHANDRPNIPLVCFQLNLQQYSALLQVRDSAHSVAAPAQEAQEKEAAAKQARRNKFAATGPVRKSSRAGAVKTAARLQAQAKAASSDDAAGVSEASDEEDVAEASDISEPDRKRKRGSPEEDFDPAGSLLCSMLTGFSCEEACCLRRHTSG